MLVGLTGSILYPVRRVSKRAREAHATVAGWGRGQIMMPNLAEGSFVR